MANQKGRVYETVELCVSGAEPTGSHVCVDLQAEITCGEKCCTLCGFYAGGGVYKVRFLPQSTGIYNYTITGSALTEPVTGSVEVEAGDGKHHGIVHPEGTHLKFDDGSWFYSFGTTVYALAHQSDALMDETIDTLSKSPFNKVRMCLFPKHYNYNFNEPQHYAFCPKAGLEHREFPGEKYSIYPVKHEAKDDYWDVHHPDFAFWDAFEGRLQQLQDLGIQVDLILFHPYDRWGFSNLEQADNLVYLDYLLRRFSAFPHMWWSLANEYDLCFSKTIADWEEIEAYVAQNDPYHHMLGNHNCFRIWDPKREYVTHTSWQTKCLYHVAEMARIGKPVLIDECRYEGNLPEFWGNLSGAEMTRSFWRVTAQGGYCTHGETYLPGTDMAAKATKTGEESVVWWAKGGLLNGDSPAHIAFLRGIIESLPGPLDPLPGLFSRMTGVGDEEARKAVAETLPPFLKPLGEAISSMSARERDFFYSAEYDYAGHCGELAYLWYKDDQSCARADLDLPEGHSYRIEVIDTWEMTRETVQTGVSGKVSVALPGKTAMAILAIAES